jgi:hypothetical protein
LGLDTEKRSPSSDMRRARGISRHGACRQDGTRRRAEPRGARKWTGGLLHEGAAPGWGIGGRRGQLSRDLSHSRSQAIIYAPNRCELRGNWRSGSKKGGRGGQGLTGRTRPAGCGQPFRARQHLGDTALTRRESESPPQSLRRQSPIGSPLRKPTTVSVIGPSR